MPDTLRAFVAVELPAEGREALRQLQARWRPLAPPGARWTDPQGIHLTLKFLGDLPQDRVPLVTEALEQAAQGVPPFTLALGEPGAFPNLRRPRVLWVGIMGEIKPLLRLQRRVEEALATLELSREERPFSAHLTLARVRDPRQAVPAFPGSVPSFEWRVERIVLMRSTLLPSGALYTPLSMVDLVS